MLPPIVHCSSSSRCQRLPALTNMETFPRPCYCIAMRDKHTTHRVAGWGTSMCSTHASLCATPCYTHQQHATRLETRRPQHSVCLWLRCPRRWQETLLRHASHGALSLFPTSSQHSIPRRHWIVQCRQHGTRPDGEQINQISYPLAAAARSNALRSVCCVPASVSTTQDQEGVAYLIPWPQRVVRRRDERTGMPPLPEVA